MVQKDGAQKSAEAFRTISEVAELIDTPAHVLRFWESRFPQIKPVKRAGGRRYYRPADISLLDGIRKLLHEDGITIRGVQKILREQGPRHVAELSHFGETIGEEAEAEAPASTAASGEPPAQPPAAPPPAAAPEPAAPEPAAGTPSPQPRARSTREPRTSDDSPELPFGVPAAAAKSAAGHEDSPISVRLRAIPQPLLAARQADLAPLRDRLAELHARLVDAQSRPQG